MNLRLAWLILISLINFNSFLHDLHLIIWNVFWFNWVLGFENFTIKITNLKIGIHKHDYESAYKGNKEAWPTIINTFFENFPSKTNYIFHYLLLFLFKFSSKFLTSYSNSNRKPKEFGDFLGETFRGRKDSEP